MLIQVRLTAKKESDFNSKLHDKVGHLQFMSCGRIGVMNHIMYESPVYRPMTRQGVLENFTIDKAHDNSETYESRYKTFMDKLFSSVEAQFE